MGLVKNRSASNSKKKSSNSDSQKSDLLGEPPYKVRFPGQRRFPGDFGGGGGYALREFKDPRLVIDPRRHRVFDPFLPNSEDEITNSEDESEDEYEDVESTVNILVVLGDDDDWKDHFKQPDAKEMKAMKRRHKKCLERRAKDRPQLLKKQDCDCAEAAIKFYNEKHGTDYEIVETLGSYTTVEVGFWYHCNFRAQSKSDTHSSPKLFFAELYHLVAYKLVVNGCKMLDGPGNRAHIVRGCGFCRNQLEHPVNGFEVGW